MDLCGGNAHCAQTSHKEMKPPCPSPKNPVSAMEMLADFFLVPGSEDLFGRWKAEVDLLKDEAELLREMAQSALSLQPGTPTVLGNPRIPDWCGLGEPLKPGTFHSQHPQPWKALPEGESRQGCFKPEGKIWDLSVHKHLPHPCPLKMGSSNHSLPPNRDFCGFNNSRKYQLPPGCVSISPGFLTALGTFQAFPSANTV